MASTLNFNFSETFEGSIWSMLTANPSHLILEIRNENKHEVRFAVFDYGINRFLWKDVLFPETWWIGLTAVSSNVLFLHTYKNLNNPDGKSLMAFDFRNEKILWEHDHFSFIAADNQYVEGQFTTEDPTPAILDLQTGTVLENKTRVKTSAENITLSKPFQYKEGSDSFETVKSFLARKLQVELVAGVEYYEYNSLIFISYHVREENLVNYLIVFSAKGQELLREKLDKGLKGIGFETFFILEGCLIFVRNKCELVSFRIV